MKVDLFQCTDFPMYVMTRACQMCTGICGKAFDDVELVTKVLRSGHESIAEHVNFTFLIEGISRACSHQLVRHRHCSFSQLSQRYAKVGTIEEAREAYDNLIDENFDDGLLILNKYFVIPEQIEEHCTGFTMTLSEIFVVYHEYIEGGAKEEDARAILPTCTKTNVMMTVNLRELMHICNERLCNRAQGEIRELVTKMRDLVIEEIPAMVEFLVPKCEKYGHCFEEKSCGLMPKMGIDDERF